MQIWSNEISSFAKDGGWGYSPCLSVVSFSLCSIPLKVQCSQIFPFNLKIMISLDTVITLNEVLVFLNAHNFCIYMFKLYWLVNVYYLYHMLHNACAYLTN